MHAPAPAWERRKHGQAGQEANSLQPAWPLFTHSASLKFRRHWTWLS